MRLIVIKLSLVNAPLVFHQSPVSLPPEIGNLPNVAKVLFFYQTVELLLFAAFKLYFARIFEH